MPSDHVAAKNENSGELSDTQPCHRRYLYPCFLIPRGSHQRTSEVSLAARRVCVPRCSSDGGHVLRSIRLVDCDHRDRPLQGHSMGGAAQQKTSAQSCPMDGGLYLAHFMFCHFTSAVPCHGITRQEPTLCPLSNRMA